MDMYLKDKYILYSLFIVIIWRILFPAGKASSKITKSVSDELSTYYDNITKAILGSDEELMKVLRFELLY